MSNDPREHNRLAPAFNAYARENGLAFLGVLSILIGIPFWLLGRQSPVPILNKSNQMPQVDTCDGFRPLTPEESATFEKSKRRKPVIQHWHFQIDDKDVEELRKREPQGEF